MMKLLKHVLLSSSVFVVIETSVECLNLISSKIV